MLPRITLHWLSVCALSALFVTAKSLHVYKLCDSHAVLKLRYKAFGTLWRHDVAQSWI